MIFYLLSKAVATFAAFLYPAWMTFKTLARRPGHETQAARWMMYWTIVAMIVAFEYTFEWLVNWIWLYYEVKTLFLLFLALPQTEGSTYIYQQFVWPQFIQHEALIDEYLASLQSQFLSTIQAQIQRLWEMVFGAVNANSQPDQRPPLGKPSRSSASGRNEYEDPNAPPGASNVAQDLWNAYGPSVMAAGASLLQPKEQQAPSQQRQPGLPRPQNGTYSRARPSNGSTRSASSINTRRDTKSPAFPMPQQPLYPDFVPFNRAGPGSSLPHHPPPVYTRGHSEIEGDSE